MFIFPFVFYTLLPIEGDIVKQLSNESRKIIVMYYSVAHMTNNYYYLDMYTSTIYSVNPGYSDIFLEALVRYILESLALESHLKNIIFHTG